MLLFNFKHKFSTKTIAYSNYTGYSVLKVMMTEFSYLLANAHRLLQLYDHHHQQQQHHVTMGYAFLTTGRFIIVSTLKFVVV